MDKIGSLEFVASAPETVDVTIDASIWEAQQIFDRFAKGFSFPEYFGHNWNALIDCLSDLWWLQVPEVVVDHPSIPRLAPDDLQLYLDCIVFAADRRTADILPRLRLVFRTTDRDAVTLALGQLGQVVQ